MVGASGEPASSYQSHHVAGTPTLCPRGILFHETQIPPARFLCGISELNIYFCGARVSTTAHLFGGKHIKGKYTLKQIFLPPPTSPLHTEKRLPFKKKQQQQKKPRKTISRAQLSGVVGTKSVYVNSHSLAPRGSSNLYSLRSLPA